MRSSRACQILLVDDCPLILTCLRTGLRFKEAEWTLTFAEHPKRAIELVLRNHFDVVISDVGLPDMNGVELVQTIATISPVTACLLMSGTEPGAEGFPIDGAFRVLRKPFGLDELVREVDGAVVRHRRNVPEEAHCERL
ncbi:MAG: response regulator [Lentisphaerae bacterium]|nr:response regulator [Lentisphaerota bacterium]